MEDRIPIYEQWFTDSSGKVFRELYIYEDGKKKILTPKEETTYTELPYIILDGYFEEQEEL